MILLYEALRSLIASDKTDVHIVQKSVKLVPRLIRGNDMDEEKVRLNIYVASSIMEKLQMIKKETGRSLLDLVREALWKFIKQYEAENGGK